MEEHVEAWHVNICQCETWHIYADKYVGMGLWVCKGFIVVCKYTSRCSILPVEEATWLWWWVLLLAPGMAGVMWRSLFTWSSLEVQE